MTSDGLLKHLKSLRNTNQKFKKEHAATYELITCVFDLCHIDTTDGLLPAIIKAKGKKPPSYYFPIGVKNRNEKSLKEQIEESQINHAEERKRSDAKIEELNKKVAELQSTVNEMIAKREGAQKLGMRVIGGTSLLPVLAECNQVLTNKVVELKSTLSEVTPKQGKEGKAHTYNSTLMAMLRRLVADSGIPEERLCQVVHYVYAALFHKPYDGDVPSAQCVRDWIDDLNYKDMEMLTALLKNVCKTRSVHILADSSKRDVERHAIQVTFWDDEKDQPVTVTVALAVVADASSTALAKLTLSALLTAGVTFEHTIESPFSRGFTTDGASAALKEQRELFSLASELASVVWQNLLGSGLEPDSKAVCARIEVTCDLHAMSLGLTNGSKAALGVKGDMTHLHVLQLGYKVAYIMNTNWKKYKRLWEETFGEKITKPQMLVETRWGYVLQNMRWLLQNGVETKKLFEFGQKMVQAQQSTSVERAIWQDIVQWILHPALRVQVQMFVEFGETFFDKEFAWSEMDDKEYGTGAGFKLFKLPLRAALREVTLRAMLQDIESAFPKTFSAVSTEGSKVQDFAAFSEERKAEIVTFVQEFRATLMRNSAERVWKPTVLWGCLAEPSVEKNVADAILTHVFQQEPDAAFQPSKLSDPLEQEAWDLLKEKIKSKSAEMRDVWTNDWKLDLQSDDTKEYVQELIDLRAGLANLRDSRFASLRNKTQAKEEAPVKVPMPRWLRLFQSMFFSIRHHSQTTEEVFKHVDDLRNCTNLGMDRAAARVLCRMNIIQSDLHVARSEHVPVAGRMSKEEKKTEAKRASLKRTSVTCKRITEMALASAAKNYTRHSMEAVRLARRPEAIAKRKRESDVFQEDMTAKLKYWGNKQRTEDEAKLAATAAATPLVKKKKDDGKHPLEGKINAVKAVFTERNLTHVTHTQAANGQKAKVLTGDDLMKAVYDYLDGIEEEERTAIINECCDKHEEASSARAAKKAKASSGVEASTSSGAPS
jgi:hypothetical protein